MDNSNENVYGEVLSVERIQKGRHSTIQCKIKIEDEKIVLCKISFFCPLEVGDSIVMFKREIYEQNKMIVFHLMEPPLVIISNKDKPVESCFYKCKSKNVDYKFMTKLIHHFRSISDRTGDKLVTLINNFTCKYIRAILNHENKNRILIQEFTEVEFNLDKSGNIYNELNMIFKNWYKKRILRQYHLFGFMNYEIKLIDKFVCANGEYLHIIFQEFLKNPYLFFVIDYKKLSDIALKLEVINELGRQQYECLRELYTEFERGNNGYSEEHFLCMNGERMLKDLSRFLVSRNGNIYFRYTFNIEFEVYKLLEKIQTKKQPKFNEEILENLIEALSFDQQEAIRGALCHPMSIICGAAGTGKTTILKTFVNILESSGYQIALASFTGKAVARIKQVLGRENAHTLHYIIKKKLPIDILIIDEASMVSMELFYYTLKSINDNTLLYMIGDFHQLPPIEWGRPFFDLILSNKVPLFELKKYHRFYTNEKNQDINGIVENSKGLREEKAQWNLTERDNFRILTSSSIKTIIQQCIDEKKSYKDFVILSPFNKLLPEINQMASDMFLPENEEITDASGKKWRLGDKVIHTKNNYNIGIMNGDEGYIKEFAKEGDMVKSIKVQFNKDLVEFLISIESNEDTENVNNDDLEEDIEDIGLPTTKHLCRSFALTIHKSQGSEWKYVVLFIQSGGGNSFINRNLFYTAITRCKEHLWIIPDRHHILQKSIQNESKFGNDYLVYLCRENLTEAISTKNKMIDELTQDELDEFTSDYKMNEY